MNSRNEKKNLDRKEITTTEKPERTERMKREETVRKQGYIGSTYKMLV
jgi:hypothetical protein